MHASVRRATRRTPNRRTEVDDSWVDRVADTVQALLAEEGLDMEMIVWYNPVTETLHAVGFDEAPARYFRCVSPEDPSQGAPSSTLLAVGEPPKFRTDADPAIPLPLLGRSGPDRGDLPREETPSPQA